MPRHQIATVLLSCCLAACTTWHVEPGVSPLVLIATEHPAIMRVTRSDSSEVVLDNPRIAGSDTLVGDGHKAPVKVPVSEVRAVAVRSVSSGKTIGLVFGLSAVAGIVILAEALSNMSLGFGCGC
jgi:hypothetical protein